MVSDHWSPYYGASTGKQEELTWSTIFNSNQDLQGFRNCELIITAFTVYAVHNMHPEKQQRLSQKQLTVKVQRP